MPRQKKEPAVSTAKLSDEAMQQLREDLVAAQAGDEGARSCIESIAVEIAERLVYLEGHVGDVVSRLKAEERQRLEAQATMTSVIQEARKDQERVASLSAEVERLRLALLASTSKVKSKPKSIEEKIALIETP